MKELFDSLSRTQAKGLVLLDTCFLIDIFVHHKEGELLEFCDDHDVALTSFNAEELSLVLHRHQLSDIRHRVRNFFKKNSPISILDIPVSPGQRDLEKNFVASVDPFLAKEVPDPSDAVLMAAAITHLSKVLTKDKHHLFTVVLEKYVSQWGLHLAKNFKDL